ncbi:glycosyltransferase [Pedobacter sp. L105]|uniref:glycosyltransferase n=1 Tax=Pedobacter sp. L105 TaxID=1641871 RepID=UPI00131C219A|nr:glycosyltransferase [Pedobacter sp. L105]
MPKILRVLNRLNVGGPTYNVAYLAKHMALGYETRVLAGIKEPQEGSSAYMLEDLGVPYEYVPDMFRSINPKKDFRALRHIQHAVKEYKPDIVHTHAAKAGVLGRLAAYHSAHRPKAILHTYHGNVFDGYFSPVKTKVFLAIERYLAGISNAIISISEQQKYDLVNTYHIAPASKIHVIKLGFDLEKFADNQASKRLSFRQFYHLAEDDVVITITGRLAPIKNHFLFLDTLKVLKDTHPELRFKVFIVGDGELLEPIITMIGQFGFTCCRANENYYAADIIFTSWRKDIDVINAGSDIIALTSLNEGTPVSIIEAMAAQKGVICTDVGGVRDVVKDGHNGFICEQQPAAYAKKLRELIVNKSLREEMAANGKRIAFQNYSYHRLVQETEDLYKFLMQ